MDNDKRWRQIDSAAVMLDLEPSGFGSQKELGGVIINLLLHQLLAQLIQRLPDLLDNIDFNDIVRQIIAGKPIREIIRDLIEDAFTQEQAQELASASAKLSGDPGDCLIEFVKIVTGGQLVQRFKDDPMRLIALGLCALSALLGHDHDVTDGGRDEFWGARDA